MLRHSTLPLACLGLAIAVAIYAVPVSVSAQDLSTQDQSVQDRLDRLERDLNMLQRQVYRGAPTPMSNDPTAAASAEIRVERLEQQMRDLTGRVEEYANQVNQLRQRIEQINSDMQVREGQGGGAPAAPANDADANPPPPYGTEARQTAARGGVPPTSEAVGPGSVVPGPGVGSGSGPQPIFGTLTPPGEMPPAPAPGTGMPPQPPLPGMQTASRGPAGALPSGSPVQQYNYAFGLVKRANYAGAETALKEFIAQHPRDSLTSSAQYWLGETYYARGKYMEAASAFADGYKRYPRGPKAAEELLKLSMALGHANQKQNACVALAQLDHAFPKTGAAIRRAASEEKRRLGCG